MILSFFIADLKDDETDIIKSLAQIMSYGINQKRLIFNKSPDFNAINFKCIIFTKDELWVFEPSSLKHYINKFIKYANKVRKKFTIIHKIYILIYKYLRDGKKC